MVACKNWLTPEIELIIGLLNEVCQQPPEDVLYSTKKKQVQYQYTITVYKQDHTSIPKGETYISNNNIVKQAYTEYIQYQSSFKDQRTILHSHNTSI